MVISYMRRFLFVHIYKAAGMSIEKALRPYDVRAALTGRPAAEQRELLKGLGLNPAILDMQRHVFARDVRDAIGSEAFARLFKFAVVRNPWDLQLSLYHFNRLHPEFLGETQPLAPTFEARILGLARMPHPTGQQKRFVVDSDGSQLVDFVGRFENLAADMAQVSKRIGVDLQLEHINRTEHAPWQQSYSREMFNIVRDIHRIDIDAFGYSDDPAAYGII